MATKYFVICSGGPGLFHAADLKHDVGWGAFVSAPVFRMDSTGTPSPPPLGGDEKIWALIYRPAYILRWEDDLKAAPGTGQEEDVQFVRSKGASSYVDHLERRHKARGWELEWFDDKVELWDQLRAIPGKISRFWMYGHGVPGQLWLRLGRPPNRVIGPPEKSEIIEAKDIEDNFDLADKFINTIVPTTRFNDTAHRIITCNSRSNPAGERSIAEIWRDVFQVHVSGRRGKADFTTINSSNFPDMSGEPDTTLQLGHTPTGVTLEAPFIPSLPRELLATYGSPENAKKLFKQIFGTTPTGTVEETYQAVDSHFSTRNIDNYTKIGGHVPLIFRSLWGKLPGRILRSTIEIETDYKGIVIHQSKGYDGATPRDIEEYQMIKNNKEDIFWHFIVNKKGDVYEGKNLNFRGKQFSDKALEKEKVGICVIGDFENVFFGFGGDSLTDHQEKSLKKLVGGLKEAFPSITTVDTHKKHETKKKCPGENLKDFVSDLKKLVI